MAILSAPKGNGVQNDAASWCRLNFALAGGDKVFGLTTSFVSGRTVRLAQGQGVAGGVEFTNTAAADFTSAVNTSTNPRIDRLVARKTWPSLDVEVAIVQGVAGSNPTIPALTQSHSGVWEYGLAYWQVPANSGATIVNGEVWGHGQDSGGIVRDLGAGGNGANIPTNTSVLVLQVNSDPANGNGCVRAPSAVTVDFETVVYIMCPAGNSAGTVTVQMANKSRVEGWKSVAAGMIAVPCPIRRAGVANPGDVAVNISVSTEGASQPVVAHRLTWWQRQVMW